MSRPCREVLECIVEHSARHHGRPPSGDEIAAMLEKGRTTIHVHLTELVADGWLIRNVNGGVEVAGSVWLPPEELMYLIEPGQNERTLPKCTPIAYQPF